MNPRHFILLSDIYIAIDSICAIGAREEDTWLLVAGKWVKVSESPEHVAELIGGLLVAGAADA